MKLLILFTLLVASVFGNDTEEIKKTIQNYVEAYNKKDAEKVASYWSDKAIYIDPQTHEKIEGRNALKEEFEDQFDDMDGAQLEITVESVELQDENSAIVKGKSALKEGNQILQSNLFSAQYEKEGQQWHLMGVDEIEWMTTHSNGTHLKELEWLIGDWEDTSDTFDVLSKYQWDKHKNFIIQDFTVNTLGKLDIEGKQIIGWDPVKKQVRSWMFDSEGGYAEALWHKQGNKWIAEMVSTLPDGERGSQVFTIAPIDNNSYMYEIVDRDVDGVILPNIEPVKIVRKRGA